MEGIKDYIIIDGRLKKLKDSEDDFKVKKNDLIYEVIRVIDGVGLFLEDHLDRMYESFNIINKPLKLDRSILTRSINDLIVKNKIDCSNIKLVAWKDEKEHFMVYSVESFYPDESMYIEGIKTILYRHERPNPNAKIQASEFRKNLARLLEEKKAFEALLVSKEDLILEGSRSNIFFLKGNSLITAPENLVLKGITRKYIIEAGLSLGLNLETRPLDLGELGFVDGAFMSGTSVNILPISTIEDLNLGSTSNIKIIDLSRAFRSIIDEYISSKKN